MKQQQKQTRKTPAKIVLILAAFLIVSCQRDPRLDALVTMEQPGPMPMSDERVQELKDTIAEYESVVNSKVQAATKQATYLKLLAQEYMRAEIYGPALDALEEAIVLEPRNQVLHQLSGVCAGFLAKAQTRPESRAAYLMRAEMAYRMSLEIDPGYLDGLFGLAALYHFEMARHLDAIELLDRLLDKAPGHISGLFVLARSHAALGNIDDAVAAYDRIIDGSADRSVATQARRNRQLLTGEAR